MKFTMDQRNILTPLQEMVSDQPIVSIALNVQTDLKGIEKSRLVFKNFIKEAEKKTRENYPAASWDSIETQLDRLYQDNRFWQQNYRGVIVIANQEELYTYHFPFELQKRVVVDRLPYILPMVEHEQLFSHYHVLCLNQQSIRFFDVNHQEIEEEILPEDAPRTLQEALGNQLTGGELNFSSRGSGAGSVIFHGSTSKNEEMDKDLKNYFQLVDRYITEYYSKEYTRPLVLFSLTENRGHFIKLSRNPYLEKDLYINASASELETKKIVEKIHEFYPVWREMMVKELKKDYDKMYSEEKSTHFYDDIQFASQEGRIKQLWFSLDEVYQEAHITDYNRMAYQSIKNGGDVYILPDNVMPEKAKFVGLLRY
ncbi:hypothetical protein [Vagococcus humatus]|uniref:Bacterial archaeo-eukaryotic release factor family 6 domain-containing protein n=1 Tax=Vagococcus humatus TaxID=1889241 RepID=A0A429Z5B4_9ENTE|nr:hypothetical protein [Vagococcus humatus]RST88878.1 hypothetical protein C7P63_08640 [Vagococcus humatus]